MKLSARPMTPAPKAARMSAFPQLPAAARRIDAGTQTIGGPMTGTIEKMPATVPQRMGDFRSSRMKMSAVRPPWARATAPMP